MSVPQRLNPLSIRHDMYLQMTQTACCPSLLLFLFIFPPFFLCQGLELVNPNADAEKKVKEANKKWFDSSSGFMSAKPK